MKKNFAIILGVLFLAACGPEKEVDINYQLTANVSVSSVVQGMRVANNKDYYTKDSKDPVQLTCLVYDSRGNLVYETEKKLENFFEDWSYSTSIEGGNYTLVTWACIYYSGKQTWVSKDKNSLSTLKLVLNSDIDATTKPILGVDKKSVSLNDSETVKLDVQTVGCFFSICFNYPSTTNADIVYCVSDEDSDTYTVDTGRSDYYVDSDDGAWEMMFELDKKYAGIYFSAFTLPMDQNIFWAVFDSNINLLDPPGVNSFTLRAEAAKHQFIDVDIVTKAVTPTTFRSSGLPESSGKQQVFDVGKMKSESAHKLLDSLRR